MAAFNKFDQTVEDIMKGEHDFETDQLRIALTAPANAPVAANSVLSDLTEISYTNLSSRDVTTTSAEQTSGILAVVLVDLELSATGAVAEFRYVVLYNSVNDKLIGWYDYGEGLTLGAGESLTLDWPANALTLA